MRLSTVTSHSNIALLVLSILSHEDMYGYQMVITLREKSQGYYMLRESSMYPTLYHLMEKGYISTSREGIVNKRVRVYYHIEEKGRQYLEELKKIYLDSARGVCSVLGYDIKLDPVSGALEQE